MQRDAKTEENSCIKRMQVDKYYVCLHFKYVIFIAVDYATRGEYVAREVTQGIQCVMGRVFNTITNT